MASGDCDYVQLSRLDLKDSTPEVKVRPNNSVALGLQLIADIDV